MAYQCRRTSAGLSSGIRQPDASQSRPWKKLRTPQRMWPEAQRRPRARLWVFRPSSRRRADRPGPRIEVRSVRFPASAQPERARSNGTEDRGQRKPVRASDPESRACENDSTGDDVFLDIQWSCSELRAEQHPAVSRCLLVSFRM